MIKKFQSKQILNQSGQSLVEYIMLLAVVFFLVSSVFNSSLFQDFFGPQGTFSRTFKGEVEFSYRHALRGVENYRPPNYQTDQHPSYVGPGGSRFFGAKEKYPKN
jgi:hypothetical protein